MSVPAEQLSISVADYLDGEQSSPVRHDYLDGEVRAMAGADEAHNLIAGNLYVLLRTATRGQPCTAFMADMKVRVESVNRFYYPDVLLTCEPSEPKALFKRAPCLLAEVLSTSTEAIDRGEKLLAYRTLDSLRWYLLLAQDRPRLELYRRTGNGGWQWEVHEQGEITLDCGGLPLRLALADLYEDVAL